MQGSTKYDFINRSADASRNRELAEKGEGTRQQDSVDSTVSTYLGFFVGLAIAAALIALITFVLKFGVQQSSEIENWALTGDFIGGVVGTALSFGTLAVVLIALIFQVRITEITGETLNEAEKARKAAESQAQSATRMVEDARSGMQNQLGEQRRQLLLSATIQLIEQRRLHLQSIKTIDRHSRDQVVGEEALESEVNHWLAEFISVCQKSGRKPGEDAEKDLSDFKGICELSEIHTNVVQLCMSIKAAVDFFRRSGVSKYDPIVRMYCASISWSEHMALHSFLMSALSFDTASRIIRWTRNPAFSFKPGTPFSELVGSLEKAKRAQSETPQYAGGDGLLESLTDVDQ